MSELFQALQTLTRGGESGLVAQGLPFGWVALLGITGAALIFWAYRWSAPDTPPARRRLLGVLRSVVLFLILLLLADPVLVIEKAVPVRSSLLVLVDNSRSMQIADERESESDRAAAVGLAGEQTPERRELVIALAENRKLELFEKLAEVVDVQLISFGRDLVGLGEVKAGQASQEASALLRRLAFDEDSTALGDALAELAGEWRGSPLAGVFVVSDGASNTGREPLDGAKTLASEKLPVFAYGTGVVGVRDLQVVTVMAPSVGFVKEKVEARGLLRMRGYPANTEARVTLQSNGKAVAEKTLMLSPGSSEVALEFTPEMAGDVEMVLSVEPLEDEAETANNRNTAKLRVVEQKVSLLYIEQEPRWDFRYITNALKDDRRVALSCHVVFGEREMAGEDYKHFLDKMPEAEEMMKYQVVLLGDVDPAALGAPRMEALKRMVGDTGAGLIFLAGPRFNPLAYRETPLESLLPVDLGPVRNPEAYANRSAEPGRLLVTEAGALSPMLALADSEAGSKQAWEAFRGVRWFSTAALVKPTAETLLTSTTGVPVVALQSFGRGQTLYFGTDETYRWRSGVGGASFVRLWTQIIQSFALERLAGASDRVQLRPARPLVLTGEPVEISGRVFDADFRPVTEPQIEGDITREGGGMEPQRVRLALSGTTPGLFSGSWTPVEPGSYTFVPLLDRSALIRFEVKPRDAELLNLSMERDVLESLAKQTGGAFLTEADLPRLPELVKASQATTIKTERLEIARQAWLLLCAALLLCAEWALRRLSALK